MISIKYVNMKILAKELNIQINYINLKLVKDY